MPDITARAKVFRDWEGLLGAVERNTAILPGVDGLRSALENALAFARDLKLKQEGLAGNKQGVTEQLKQAVQDGRETARMLRAFVKSHLGSRSEALKEFGISPIRARKLPKPKTPELPPPATGNPEAEAPAS
jgi:hypothetical protein